MNQFLKLYATGLIVCFGLDLLWLGVVARGFYQRELGHLMRADVKWFPAILFYVIFVAALTVVVAMPAIEKRSLATAAMTGALFGLAAYAAFDLTGLALLKDFPMRAAVIDLVWGTVLATVVSVVQHVVGRR